LGTLLRQHRESQGLLQEELAALVTPALSHNTISNVERGRTRPRRYTLDTLADALGLNADERAELHAARRAFRSARLPDMRAQHAMSTGRDGTEPARGGTIRELRPHNLPAPVTSLIGREREITAVLTHLQSPEVRLLTLTGPGGIGKTRLAVEAVERLDGFVDGTYFVSLAAITDPSLVVHAIAQALGLPDAGGDLHRGVRDYLCARQLLLVLDNFEHLLPAAKLVRALLSEARGLKVLVTSREALRTSGEQLLIVPPLGVPNPTASALTEHVMQSEAVRLFIERARAVSPGFPVANDDVICAADVCRQLDGLPLAIELAAAHLRHMTPQELLVRLQTRLFILTDGTRDAPARHQTLRAAIAWSYDLLSVEEQLLFRRLAAFAAGCTLQAAEAVSVFANSIANDELESEKAPDLNPCASIGMLERMASLVDKSLLEHQVRPSGESRYTMLETVRAYALEQLVATGEEELTRARHAAYYEMLVEHAAPRFLAEDQLVWLTRIDDELDNLRAVFSWFLEHDQYERGQSLAGSLWYFWSIHSRVSEGHEWLARLLAGSSGYAVSDQVRARAMLALGFIAHRQFDIAASEEAFAEAHHLARRAGDAWTTGMALMRSAWISQRRSDWSATSPGHPGDTYEQVAPGPMERFEEALTILRSVGDRWGLAQCLAMFAAFLVPRDAIRARQFATEAVEIGREVGERHTLATAVGQLARLAVDAGEPLSARHWIEERLALAHELNDLFDEGICFGLLAQLSMDEFRFAEGQDLQEQRAAKYHLLGARPLLAEALHDLAVAARLAGDLSRAREAFDESLSLVRDSAQDADLGALLASLGHLHKQTGAHRLAASTFAECLRVVSFSGPEFGVPTILAGQAGLALDAGRTHEAARLLGVAEGLLALLLEGPYRIDLSPSQTTRASYQYRRDTWHVRELRLLGLAAFEEIGVEAFESALAAGRALTPEDALALAMDIAAERGAHGSDSGVGARTLDAEPLRLR
jgi:predicted ATPase/transcriptional regulator with XRE-family HTH domain